MLIRRQRGLQGVNRLLVKADAKIARVSCAVVHIDGT
jgi:hypothetical protein